MSPNSLSTQNEEYREVEQLIEKSTKFHPDNDEIDDLAHAHWK